MPNSNEAKTSSYDSTKPKPASRIVRITYYADGKVSIDMPTENTLKILSRIADYEIKNNLCG